MGARAVECVVNVPEEAVVADLVEQVGAAERDQRLGVNVGDQDQGPLGAGTSTESVI